MKQIATIVLFLLTATLISACGMNSSADSEPSVKIDTIRKKEPIPAVVESTVEIKVTEEEPKYYYSFPLIVTVDHDNNDITDYEKYGGNELSDSQKDVCCQVYMNIITYYGLTDKKMPKFCSAKTMPYSNTKLNVAAFYSSKDKTIYLKEDFSGEDQYDLAILAHEICHSLVGDGNYTMYNLDSNYATGMTFNEGCVNYISSQLYPYPSDVSVYEYPTHFVKLFANGIGEEKFRKAFFDWDIETMRQDFNEVVSEYYKNVEDIYHPGLILSPFDALIGNLDMYDGLLNTITDETYENNRDLIMKLVNSMDEELVIYNVKKERTNASEIVKSFVANENRITWSYFSKLLEIAETRAVN